MLCIFNLLFNKELQSGQVAENLISVLNIPKPVILIHCYFNNVWASQML